VDNPNDVFVATEFRSAQDAKAFRERLVASGALDGIAVRSEPTVAEREEQLTYQ
jgi:hypothetical protein